MPDRYTAQHREVGMLRIYLDPSDKIGSRRFWGAKPLYRELIYSSETQLRTFSAYCRLLNSCRPFILAKGGHAEWPVPRDVLLPSENRQLIRRICSAEC